MLDAAISKTTQCRFKLGCLGKDPRYPVCTVVGANGDNALFLINENTGINCQYRGASVKGCSCSCPTHYSLYRKHQWMGSIAMSEKEKDPEQCQHAKGSEAMPKTIEAAVHFLINALPQKYQLTITNMDADEIGESAVSLIKYIQDAFDLVSGNMELIRSCSEEAGCEVEHPEDASAFILSRLVMELAKSKT